MAEEKKTPTRKAETAAKKPAAKKADAPKAAAKKSEPAPKAAAAAAEKKAPEAKKPAPKKATEPKAAAKPVAKAKKPGVKYIRVTQIGSPIGRRDYQRQTLIGLGLNKMHRSRELEDTPAVRGMANSIPHLVKVEEVA